MHKWFHTKMAISNLFKNRRIFLPYILMSVGIITMFYIMHSIAVNDGLNNLPGAAAVSSIMFFGTIVIGIFSAIFMFYTNSFLIKQRKKEIGLYSILGLEKKHIAKMLSIEMLLIAFIALGVGLSTGVLLSKLMFMILLKLMGFDVSMQFAISASSLMITSALFGSVFLATLLYNIGHIHLLKPIELLKGGNLGEREPRTKWIMALIGVICLGFGYYISLTVTAPLEAIFSFFIAVVLVIIGTHSLFTAGSIVVLKALRKKKSFYYKTKNFTSISGMIYRMKQNAVGLANICILSTAVLVSLSTTISLYVGMEDVLNSRYPYEVSIMMHEGDAENHSKVMTLIEDLAVEKNVRLTDFATIRGKDFPASFDAATKTIQPVNTFDMKMSFVQLVPLEDLNRFDQTAYELSSDEIIVYTNTEALGVTELNIGDHTFKVREELTDSNLEKKNETVLMKMIYIVVEDVALIHDLYSLYEEDAEETLNYITAINVSGSEEAELNFNRGVYGSLSDLDFDVRADSRLLSKGSFLNDFGGFLFLGIFLGSLFLMATVLIIYYKQVSEGYDDKERYVIMQQVGMSKTEVKSTIKRQIIMIFFIPLVGAVVHIAFAFNVIVKMLALFNFYNTSLFVICTAITVLIFSIIYSTVYALTARSYYKIVSD